MLVGNGLVVRTMPWMDRFERSVVLFLFVFFEQNKIIDRVHQLFPYGGFGTAEHLFDTLPTRQHQTKYLVTITV